MSLQGAYTYYKKVRLCTGFKRAGYIWQQLYFYGENIMNLLKLLTLIIIFMSTSTQAYAYEIAFSSKEVKEKILSFGKENIIILLDIDDTIITPKSLTFRTSPYNKIIDNIKANRNKYPNYEKIISNWRIQRKVILIDSDWPEILNELKNTYKVFGLTKIDTGKFGNIESMEQWRYEELKSLGINFSTHEDQSLGKANQPSFFKGIMMTGSSSKSETLEKYMSIISPIDGIVFVDDREQNLLEIKDFCKEKKIKFLAIHYKGLEKLKAQQNEEVYFLQKNTLINEGKWLSDEEASKQIMWEKK